MKDKKKSKKCTLKKKYSVEKKVKDHYKRLRKLAKNSDLKKRFKRKCPGIPNLFPFKSQMLEEIQRQRESAVAEKARKRQEQRSIRKRLASVIDEDDSMDEAVQDIDEYAMLRTKAEQDSIDYSNLNINEETKKGSNSTTFYRALRQVIEKSNVVIEVLDARDPQSCRNLNIERQAIADGKKLVLLLNKIDLVPKEVVELWLSYLRQSLPVIAFKSALTSKASRNITHVKVPHNIISKSELHVGSQVIGAPALIQLLKNYSRTDSMNSKTSISVGVIGVPNVGKSSVINSLCRNPTATKVGSEAGITRILQEINLDGGIRLIDSPGVISEGNELDAEMILRNSVKISTVKNPISVVETLLNQYPPDQIMKLFKVPFYSSTSDFLSYIGRARGKLTKGGVLDFSATAQLVLTEWTSGKICHFCLPPKEDPLNQEAKENGIISGPRFVSQFSEAFDIDSLLKS